MYILYKKLKQMNISSGNESALYNLTSSEPCLFSNTLISLHFVQTSGWLTTQPTDNTHHEVYIVVALVLILQSENNATAATIARIKSRLTVVVGMVRESARM